jgi:hypothetical protein
MVVVNNYLFLSQFIAFNKSKLHHYVRKKLILDPGLSTH